MSNYMMLPNKNGNEDFLVEIVNTFEDEVNKIKYATVSPVEFKSFEREVPFNELYEIPRFEENKQLMLDKFLETLRLCSCAGYIINNDLVELKYINDGENEWVRPIFRNGVGKNGYFDVKITGDSNIAIIMDVVEHFVRRMW